MMAGDINIDDQDLKMAQGAFRRDEEWSPEVEAEYLRWLDQRAAEQEILDELREQEREEVIF